MSTHNLGGSNEYPQSMFWAEIWKISEFLIWKFSFFLVVKFSVYLNRYVFVMMCLHGILEQHERGIHTISFLFLHENICCGYSLEAPLRGASYEYPQHMFSWRNKKNINTFQLKKAPYLELWKIQISLQCCMICYSDIFHRIYPMIK